VLIKQPCCFVQSRHPGGKPRNRHGYCDPHSLRLQPELPSGCPETGCSLLGDRQPVRLDHLTLHLRKLGAVCLSPPTKNAAGQKTTLPLRSPSRPLALTILAPVTSPPCRNRLSLERQLLAGVALISPPADVRRCNIGPRKTHSAQRGAHTPRSQNTHFSDPQPATTQAQPRWKAIGRRPSLCLAFRPSSTRRRMASDREAGLAVCPPFINAATSVAPS